MGKKWPRFFFSSYLTQNALFQQILIPTPRPVAYGLFNASSCECLFIYLYFITHSHLAGILELGLHVFSCFCMCVCFVTVFLCEEK